MLWPKLPPIVTTLSALTSTIMSPCVSAPRVPTPGGAFGDTHKVKTGVRLGKMSFRLVVVPKRGDGSRFVGVPKCFPKCCPYPPARRMDDASGLDFVFDSSGAGKIRAVRISRAK